MNGNKMRKLALLLATTVLVAPGGGALVTAPAYAQAASDTVHDFNIPAKPIRQALHDIARVAGISVMFDETAAASGAGKAVRGSMTTSEAISRALSGSRLSWRFTNASTVTIVDPAAGVSSGIAGDGTVLETITVDDRSATTEGTGSYTTGETSAATRLPLTLRQTPQSTTVVTRQIISDQKLDRIPDVLDNATGVMFDPGETDRTSVYARGFTIGEYTVDGVTRPDNNEFGGTYESSAIYDRVEIVRGATGLMKASGDPSASVNLVRKRAISTDLTGYLSGRVGSWENLGVEADVQGALNEAGTLRGRFVTDVSGGNSFLDRYSNLNQTYYGTLEADISDMTTVIGGIEHSRHAPEGSTWGSWPLVFSDGTPTDFRRGFSTGLDWTYWNSDSTTFFGRVEHEFENGWKAQATLSHTIQHYDSQLFYTYNLPDPVTGLGVQPYAGKFDRTRVATAGNVDVSGEIEALGRTHELSLGVSASRSHFNGTNAFATGLGPIDIFNWDGSYPEPTWGAANIVESEPLRQYSAYTASRLSVTDQLNLILGMRFNRWEQEPRGFNNFTPYAGAVYDFTDTFSAYASYTEIFNPQDYKDPSGTYLDPEVGAGYEVGIKGSFFDDRLNASLSLYRTQKDNVAEEIPGVFTPDGDMAYRPIKGVKTEGVEFELSGEIAPDWQLFFGASTFRSKQPDGSDHNSFLPRNSVKVFTTYQLPGEWEKLTIGGGFKWNSSSYIDIDGVTTASGTVRFKQDAFVTVDLMAKYDFTDTLVGQLNVNNVFNEKYYILRGGDNAPYGKPLNATFTLTKRF
ncbi:MULTISPECIES: TonB-dependent receptor [unclassified Shinella]|uniref:TonB-dependent siderophore receptor n=1 Tax=unclassified Shinella TaxID=2643062 RepID=UPI00234E8F4A|nr:MULTISPECIES: TonB-dependent receptor [unclassified Shinella]MCO5140161.1 TonB-dependent receptor [Shinella sp.]MDC7256821.1 TonB-dependent receptor [Shinella sp. YE25]